jgi:beta-lactamase regulating signal transducer with metallopeptidase domain
MSTWLADVSGLWWNWMAAISLQASVLVAVVAGLDRALRRWAWPRLLTTAWLVVMAKLVLPPTLTSPFSVARLLGQPPPTNLAGVGEGPQELNGTIVLFVGWAAVAVLCGGTAVWRYGRHRRNLLRTSALQMPDWLRLSAVQFSQQLRLGEVPEIRIHTGVHGPAVIGFFRPVVVLPFAFVTEATQEHVRYALLHELAHIRRRDPLWNLVCLVLQLAYWFHPLVWFARRRLSTLRELGCDELVTQVLGREAPAYCNTLLELAGARLAIPAAGTLGLFHRQGQILTRLEWLARAPGPRCRWRWVVTALTLSVLAICCVPLARPALTADLLPGAQPGTAVETGTHSTAANAAETADVPPRDDEIAFSDLQGSLQVRFTVMRLLARENERSRSIHSPIQETGGPP